MWKDVAKRPFITVGFSGFRPIDSSGDHFTASWIRRLGGKRWQQLHRAIYVTAVCGVIHYYWLVKSDVRKPLFYGALVGILLLWRWAMGFSARLCCSCKAFRSARVRQLIAIIRFHPQAVAGNGRAAFLFFFR